jgi:cobalamin-dependent methionine synthase I
LHHACKAGMDMGIVNAAQVGTAICNPDSTRQQTVWPR